MEEIAVIVELKDVSYGGAIEVKLGFGNIGNESNNLVIFLTTVIRSLSFGYNKWND